MSKKKLIIFIIALVLIAGGVGFLVYHFVSQGQREKVYEDVKPVETQVETTQPQEQYVSPVNFNDLWAINTDIYSYINIPDTDIQYPVVQGGPHENYYLDHTIEHYTGYPGAIYTQMANAKDYSDFNTVIYGHDMLDGTMFTHLHYYRDEGFFDTHREIKIYLPDKELTYTVFAAITYNDDLIIDKYKNDNVEDRKAFLDSVYGNNYLGDIVKTDVPVTENDHLITLSTCIGDLPNNRYLIIAVQTGQVPAQQP